MTASTQTGIYGYAGTLEELAIQIGRLSNKDISLFFDLLSDELYKKAVKHNSGVFYALVDQLDTAVKRLSK